MTLPRTTPDVELRRTRARANPTRQRLLDQLATGPHDVRALAAVHRLHPNAVRQHLAVLRDAGLVVEEVERVAGRTGRPRTLYRAAGADRVVSPFERLARLLVHVANGGDPLEVGRAEGHATAESARDATEAVTSAAVASGFGVAIDRAPARTRITLHGCPFADVAGDVVCALHRGVVEGAARRAGGAVVDFDINHPTVAPCTVTLGEPS